MFIDLVVSSRENNVSKKENYKTGSIPAIIFLKNLNKRILISISQGKCLKFFRKSEIFKNKIVRIFYNNIKYYTKVKLFRIHPVKKLFQFLVFSSVSFDETVTVNIPIKYCYVNECKALLEGRIFKKNIDFILLRCFISQIPNYLEVNVSLFDSKSVVYFSDIVCLNFKRFITLNIIKDSDFLFKIS